MASLFNLKTIPTAQFQAHMDRIKDTELALAQLLAGEVLDGRDSSASAMARSLMNLRLTREGLVDHYNAINSPTRG